MQQTGSVVRDSVNWWDFGSVLVYTPPKTGTTTLMEQFPHLRRTYPIPRNQKIIGGFRDPVSRWISAYNQLIVQRGKAVMKEKPLLDHFGSAWFDHWFPDTITDPIGHARRFLLEAQPEIESLGLELHFCSQSLCYRRLLGAGWRSHDQLQLIDYSEWLPTINRIAQVNILEPGNVGVYQSVPKHYYNTLYPLLEQVFEEDLEHWHSININTV